MKMRSTSVGGMDAGRSIRIVFITHSLHSGGAEKQMLWMAKVLVDAAVPCAVFELRANPGNARLHALIEATAKEGVEFFRARPRDGYLTAWVRLRSFLKGHPSAVIWTWGYRSDLFALTYSWIGLRPLWICSLRSAYWQGLHRARFLIRQCGPKISLYAANTWANCEMMGKIYSAATDRCRVVYNFVPEAAGAPVELAAEIPRPLKVLMLGNIDMYKKGYDLVVELAAAIQLEGLPIEIHVGGRPDPEGVFEKLIASRKVAGVLKYHGETGQPQNFLRSGHCFLLSSRLEGMPNALLEAMGIGLPAIATRVGDLTRLARDGREMRLVPVEDVTAIKQCLRDFLADWPRALAMGAEGRRWCRENFTDESCRQQLFEVVRMIAARR